jgi:hypothetical protein
MTQVIIFTNSNGNVSVCTPSGELPIQTVLTKDCPPGAIIVDLATLPQGDDANYQEAWVLNGSTVTVNVDKKTEIQVARTAVANSKQSANDKLAKLGLTADEIKTLIG